MQPSQGCIVYALRHKCASTAPAGCAHAVVGLQVRLVRLFRRLFLECIGGAVQPIRIRGVAIVGSTCAYLSHILFGICVFTNFIGCLWCAPGPAGACRPCGCAAALRCRRRRRDHR